MKWIYKILGLNKNLSRSQNKHQNVKDEVPVYQQLDFKTHQETVTKEFDFLTSELGFERTKNEFVSREFWTIYSRDSIDIELMFESGLLPFVTIRNRALPYDESKQLDNRDNVEEFNCRTCQIRKIRFNRNDPKNKLFLDEWLNKDNHDFSELNRDYEQYGQQEHIEYLKEAAITVRQNLELRKGVLKHPL